MKLHIIAALLCIVPLALAAPKDVCELCNTSAGDVCGEGYACVGLVDGVFVDGVLQPEPSTAGSRKLLQATVTVSTMVTSGGQTETTTVRGQGKNVAVSVVQNGGEGSSSPVKVATKKKVTVPPASPTPPAEEEQTVGISGANTAACLYSCSGGEVDPAITEASCADATGICMVAPDTTDPPTTTTQQARAPAFQCKSVCFADGTGCKSVGQKEFAVENVSGYKVEAALVCLCVDPAFPDVDPIDGVKTLLCSFSN